MMKEVFYIGKTKYVSTWGCDELATPRQRETATKIVRSLFKIAYGKNKEYFIETDIAGMTVPVTVADIAGITGFKNNMISRKLHAVELVTERKWTNGHRNVYIIYDKKLWTSVYKIYLEETDYLQDLKGKF
jgi:hypothetical protein